MVRRPVRAKPPQAPGDEHGGFELISVPLWKLPPRAGSTVAVQRDGGNRPLRLLPGQLRCVNGRRCADRPRCGGRGVPGWGGLENVVAGGEVGSNPKSRDSKAPMVFLGQPSTGLTLVSPTDC